MENSNSSVHNAVKEAAKIVSDIAGIQLGEKQYSMVESRLKSRMLKIGLKTEDEYLAYLKLNKERETEALLSLLTTHHTFFFREYTHFEYISNQHLNKLIRAAEARGDKKIRIWSAACSRGQEVYSLAMFFHYHLREVAPHIDFEIWGTDIDSESVEIAKNAVYRNEELNQSPAMYVDGHWIKGKNKVKDFSKIKESLKAKCKFSIFNLTKFDDQPISAKFDLIFCRNVFIYFNSQQVESITTKLIEKLAPEGALVLGVSESLQGLKLPIESVSPSFYQRTEDIKSAGVALEVSNSAIARAKPLNILCIDDSKTIHMLLKSILIPEQGFVIKHKAMNGAEALKLLKTEKYDAITLDLHMPVVDGLSFLNQLNQRNDKTPVIVVSSINREDEPIAKQALKLGALDYVEKPTIENLINSGNEIRAKLKSAIKLAQNKNQNSVYKASLPSKIKTLIVDDSETIRALLSKIISQDSGFEVIGVAKDAFEAAKMISQCKPDLITLDIHMPKKNGVDFLREVQQIQFIPTVMISSLSDDDGPFVMDALSAGAIDYIKKPEMKDLVKLTPIIHERLRVAAKAKKPIHRPQIRKSQFNKSGAVKNFNASHITLIGSSTGGTEAVRSILEALPNEIPPILIVQHMPAVFSKAFADRLNTLVHFEVKEAVHNDEVLPNKVLIAPGGKQMGVKVVDDKVFIQISEDPLMNRHRPSVDYLFKSVFEAKIRNATAVVLTGMGGDGSHEIAKLKSIGVNTIAQDEASSVIYGMPRAAVATGAVDYVLPLHSVAEKIISLAEDKKLKNAG
ncbi:MAG: chemotaxis-specific protein-glutamate methyltransferase CheB [Bdellovibrionota bacterium]